MFNHIVVKKRNSLELVLTRSKMKAVLELSFMVVFFGFWYSTLISDFSSIEAIRQEVIEKVSEQKFMILFYLAPLLVGKRILLGLSTIAFGNKYVFSKMKNKITHNGKELCKYHQIKHVQIRRISDSDGDDTYRIVIIHSDREKIFIAESTDNTYINGIASDIADACDTQIEYKN